jgi:hypothetical protein
MGHWRADAYNGLSRSRVWSHHSQALELAGWVASRSSVEHSVIPSLPQYLLRPVHPLVAIAPGYTLFCLSDKVFRYLQKVIVAERQPGSEVSSVRQETLFDDGNRGDSGAGDQFDVAILFRTHGHKSNRVA